MAKAVSHPDTAFATIKMESSTHRVQMTPDNSYVRLWSCIPFSSYLINALHELCEGGTVCAVKLTFAVGHR